MASAAPIVALVAAVLAVLGVLGANLGLLAPLVGFQLYAAGALLGGVVTLVVSLVALYLTRGARDPEGRRKALLGGAIGIALLAAVLVPASAAGDFPPINDITTDLADPPAFAPPDVVPAYADRDMSYPPEFVPVVRQAYPDLEPIELPATPGEAFDASLTAARTLGWEIVARDREAGVFFARDVTPLFRFVDDVVVRVRASDAGSRIDVRSKSRDGQGDLGANAKRIRAFAEELGQRAGRGARSMGERDD